MEEALAPGVVAPDFSLRTADGEIVSLDSRRGRTVVLFFVREFT